MVSIQERVAELSEFAGGLFGCQNSQPPFDEQTGGQRDLNLIAEGMGLMSSVIPHFRAGNDLFI
jgi:hypothetical protein